MKAKGVDTTKADAAYTDLGVQLAAVQVSAKAAIDGVSSLKPDNGDAALLVSNNTARKAARAQIKVGEVALKAARADVRTIAKSNQ
jgi:hypothetical protein